MGLPPWVSAMGEGPGFGSDAAARRYAALLDVADRTVIGLDFDGTLAPLVDDPTEAHIHPGAVDALAALAPHVGAVAVITGRPADQVLALGGLERMGEVLAGRGTDLFVFGQYGNERWSTRRPEILSPPRPEGLDAFEADLPDLLRTHDAEDAWIEDKHLAVAVHTRRLGDADDALARLVDPLRDLAARHDLAVEPGRHVVEVRGSGRHKGDVVHTLARELEAGGFFFAGDDLGDVEAFDAVSSLASEGLPTLLVCSATEEEMQSGTPLTERADLVVPGPDGVLDLLGRIAADADRRLRPGR